MQQKPKCDIPVSHMQERFYVDDEGRLRWKRPVATNTGWWPAGSLAGRRNNRGYVTVSVYYQGRTRKVLAHRIVWLLTHGYWPEMFIDHINRNRADDRPSNLRLVTHAENMQNRSIPSNNPFVGVYPTRSGKFRAQITRQGRSLYLGTFATAEQARDALQSAVPA